MLRAHEIRDGVTGFGGGFFPQVERDLRRKAFARDASGQLRGACAALPLNATGLAFDLEVKPARDESGDTLARSGFVAARSAVMGCPRGAPAGLEVSSMRTLQLRRCALPRTDFKQTDSHNAYTVTQVPQKRIVVSVVVSVVLIFDGSAVATAAELTDARRHDRDGPRVAAL